MKKKLSKLENNKFFVIEQSALPQIYEKVVFAKKLLANKEAKDIQEAIKIANISRSVFYKYKDKIHLLSDTSIGRKASLNILLSHETGTLSKVLDIFASAKVNILTIYQGIPIHQIASVQLTIDLSEINTDIKLLVDKISNETFVFKVELQIVE
ncbi:MAG: ACT domain-containing protein [Erysipelotrichaceae bacterium]|nr:ACT domain-containing protein [Erysipelotrichaceae bacterium]